MNLEHFKNQLLEEKQRLEKDINFYKSEDSALNRDMDAEVMDDSVTELEGHDRLTATGNQLEQALAEVRKALNRIEQDKFGVCENCGQKIDEERLEANPSAALCLSCQQKKKIG